MRELEQGKSTLRLDKVNQVLDLFSACIGPVLQIGVSMRTTDIYAFQKRAGVLTEGDDGRFVFAYDKTYLADPSVIAISCTMPLKDEEYVSDALFPFLTD